MVGWEDGVWENFKEGMDEGDWKKGCQGREDARGSRIEFQRAWQKE